MLQIDRKNKHVPRWIARQTKPIDPDQWNTRPDIAQQCLESFEAFMINDGADLSKYHFIEPSAGKGAFYDLLPPTARTGVDIDAFRPEYVHKDFLSWRPATSGPFVAIGNPPFGERGWLALAFINHCAEFCDYVGFILPMSFDSDGKGSPKTRVRGMTLMHSEILSGELFIHPNGKTLRVNTVWQIWRRTADMFSEPVGLLPEPPSLDLTRCDEYVDLFNVCTYPSRVCGMKKIADCDTFIQGTFFLNNPPGIVRSFEEVKYASGIGVLFRKDKDRVRGILERVDWNNYSNLATNNCRHISMNHVRKALLDGGLLTSK